MFKNKPSQASQVQPQTQTQDDDLGFDVEQVEIRENSFELLPKGKYVGVIEDATIEHSQKTIGCRMINFKFRIAEGQFENRVVFSRSVITHPTSQDAVDIGRSLVKTAFEAAGVAGSKLADLIGSSVFVTADIGIDKGKNGYEDKNLIRSFSAVGQQNKPVAQSTKPSFLKK